MTIVTKSILIAVTILLLGISCLLLLSKNYIPLDIQSEAKQEVVKPSEIKTPSSNEIPKKLQVFQSFNNCGPATLSMALSYFGIQVSQESLGRELRPWQNPEGKDDDKSVFLYELANKAKEYDLLPLQRPNGSLDLLKRSITHGYPVIVRTFLHPGEDIGHYRIVRGYDDAKREIIQDDSYQGASIRFSYDEFLKMWQPFNYEYLILIPKNKSTLASTILAEDTNEHTAWANAKTKATSELIKNSDDMYASFNLATSEYHLGTMQNATEDFEKIEDRLSSRMLWYQTEPIQAYLKLKNYKKVFQMTDSIISNNNLAYSELYLLRAEAYRQMGNTEDAQTELAKAKLYNQNSPLVATALRNIQLNKPLPDLP